MKVHLPANQCKYILYAKELGVIAIMSYITLQHASQSCLPSTQRHSSCGLLVTTYKHSHFGNVISKSLFAGQGCYPIFSLFEDQKTVKSPNFTLKMKPFSLEVPVSKLEDTTQT